jgi:hypothetical protein
LKLDRAGAHLDDLDRQVKDFIASEPYEMYATSPDPITQATEFRVRVHRQPPPALGLLAGDCLINLRAALDHVVYAAATAHVGGAPAKPRALQFPICLDANSFRDGATQRCIRELSQSARDAIEQLQPYHSSNAEIHPLSVLAELCNADKHRVINIVAGYAHARRHRLTQVGGPEPGVTTGVGPEMGALVDGMVVARLEAPRNAFGYVDGEVELWLDYMLVFDPNGPVPNAPLEPTLIAIRDYIRDTVLPALHPFVP